MVLGILEVLVVLVVLVELGLFVGGIFERVKCPNFFLEKILEFKQKYFGVKTK